MRLSCQGLSREKKGNKLAGNANSGRRTLTVDEEMVRLRPNAMKLIRGTLSGDKKPSDKKIRLAWDIIKFVREIEKRQGGNGGSAGKKMDEALKGMGQE